MTAKKEMIVIVFLVSTFLFLNFISAATSVILSDQGSNVTYSANGTLVNNVNLTITIYDNLTGGNLIYNETFVNAIQNGLWGVMLGTNSSNPLLLNFSAPYYKSYSINGQFLNFTNQTGATIGRQIFYSPLGDIFGNNINITANLTINNLTALSNIFGTTINGTTVYSGNNNLTIGYLYATNGTFAAYSFGANNFVGTGNFTTTGNISASNLSGQTVFTQNNLNLTKAYLSTTNGTFLFNGYANNGTWLLAGNATYFSNNTFLSNGTSAIFNNLNTTGLVNASNFFFHNSTNVWINLTTNPSNTPLSSAFTVMGMVNFTGLGNSTNSFDVYGNISGSAYKILETGAINLTGAIGGVSANTTYVTVGMLLNITTQGASNIVCNTAYNHTLQVNNSGLYWCGGNSQLANLTGF